MTFNDIKRRAGHYWNMFLFGSPVGLGYAFRLARVQYRMREMHTRIDVENQAHRNALRQLNDKLCRLVSLQQGLNIAAAQFRNCCDPAPKRSAALDARPDLTKEV